MSSARIARSFFILSLTAPAHDATAVQVEDDGK